MSQLRTTERLRRGIVALHAREGAYAVDVRNHEVFRGPPGPAMARFDHEQGLHPWDEK